MNRKTEISENFLDEFSKICQQGLSMLYLLFEN